MYFKSKEILKHVEGTIVSVVIVKIKLKRGFTYYQPKTCWGCYKKSEHECFFSIGCTKEIVGIWDNEGYVNKSSSLLSCENMF